MEKLIARFEMNPTMPNAEKLVKYVRSYPMCKCLMSTEDMNIYMLAVAKVASK